MKINFSNKINIKNNKFIIGVSTKLKLSQQIDDKIILQNFADQCKTNQFTGKLYDIFSQIVNNQEYIFIGIGEHEHLCQSTCINIGKFIFKIIKAQKCQSDFNIIFSEQDFTNDLIAYIAYGILLNSYTFTKYKTNKSENINNKDLNIISYNDLCIKTFSKLQKTKNGIFTTQNLINEPSNVLTTTALMQQCKNLTKLGVSVQVLEENEMKKLGMNALLGVGAGSVCPSYTVIMKWNGAKDKKQSPIALIGKGVCFDSGGISIKPAQNMEEMKGDMGGAAVVIGTMLALAESKIEQNVVGAIGVVENMPSGHAQRPGDIVKTMSGQTVEIINTDAEGRLVLSDVVHYTQTKYKPTCMIDLATLTGAIVVALGDEYAGLFSNNQQLTDMLLQSSNNTGEKLWHMPLAEKYDKQIASKVADMKNCGDRRAGACTAASFIQKFVNKNIPWAHIDIAGVSWMNKDELQVESGATAFGIRTLLDFIEHYQIN